MGGTNQEEVLEKDLREQINRLRNKGISWFELALDIFDGSVSYSTLRSFAMGKKVKPYTLNVMHYFLVKYNSGGSKK